MAYKRKTLKAYTRPVAGRTRSRLFLLPPAHEHLATITAAMEGINSLAPSRTLAVTLGLEMLALQAKRSPATVAKRIRSFSISQERIESGEVLPPARLMQGRLLDHLRLTDPPSDPGETCGFGASA